MDLGRNITYKSLVSQLVSAPSSFTMQSEGGVCLEENNEKINNISFKKDTEKSVFLQGLIYKLL